jgi:hypothetical protein
MFWVVKFNCDGMFQIQSVALYLKWNPIGFESDSETYMYVSLSLCTKSKSS